MKAISLKELSEIVQKEKNKFLIDGWLLRNSSIVVSGNPKSGKTSLLLQLVVAIASDEDFLDVKKGNYNIDKIFFYSNDSTDDSIKIKLDKMGFNFEDDKNMIYFLFDKKITIEELKHEIKTAIGVGHNVLLIVDVLSGVRMDENMDINNYLYMSSVIDHCEQALSEITNNFGIIFLHHMSKNNTILGSRAIASRVAATVIMSVDELSGDYGCLDIKANDFISRKLYIKKDKKKHKWQIDKQKSHASDRDVDYQLLKINEYLQRNRDHRITGNVNYIIGQTKMTISPRRLTKWLKQNKRYLNQNNIYFEIRKSNTTVIDLYVKE